MPPPGEAHLLRGLALFLGHEGGKPGLRMALLRKHLHAPCAHAARLQLRQKFFGKLQLVKRLTIVVAEGSALKQLGPPRAGDCKRFAPPPGLDVRVHAVQQHLRHLHPPELRRAGVLGVLQQAHGEALVLAGLLAAQHAGDQPRHRVHRHQRAQLAAGEHVVADGQLLVDAQIQRPLVHALVVAAEEEQGIALRVLLDNFLVQRPAPGRHVDAAHAYFLMGLDGVYHRLGQHHHARTAAEGVVVGVLVLVLGVVADVDQLHVQMARTDRPAQNAALQHRTEHLREQGQNLNLHRRTPPPRPCARCPAASRPLRGRPSPPRCAAPEPAPRPAFP